jgi:hypothetical protein
MNKIIKYLGLLQPLGLTMATVFWGWKGIELIIVNIIIIIGFGIFPYLCLLEDFANQNKNEKEN